MQEDDAYTRHLGLQKGAERRFAAELIDALARIDRALLPPAATHPLAAEIARGLAAAPDLLSRAEGGDDQAALDALDALAHVLLGVDRAPPDVAARLRALLARTAAGAAGADPQRVALITKTLAIARDEALLIEQTQRLADDDPAIVASAARLLGLGRFRPAVPALAGLVSPERLYESRHVLWALGEIGDAAALPAIEVALARAFRVVDCLIALGKIGRVTSIPLLTPHLAPGGSFPEQQDAAARALAMILDDNRALVARQPALTDVLAPMIEGQLADPRAPLSGSTRFFLLLCLARLSHPLDPARVKRYLGVPLDDAAAGVLARFAKPTR